MAHRSQSMFTLNAIDDHQRLIPRAATGPIRNGTIIRVEFEQFRNGLLEQVAIAFVCFGGEELEGDDWTPGALFCRMYVTNELHFRFLPLRYGYLPHDQSFSGAEAVIPLQLMRPLDFCLHSHRKRIYSCQPMTNLKI